MKYLVLFTLIVLFLCTVSGVMPALADFTIYENTVRLHVLAASDDAHDQEVKLLVRDAVLSGMGLIFLHSAHFSKPFRYLLGTSCGLTWRESGDSEVLWVIEPSHPITRGIDRFFTLDAEETYGEPFVIPTPDKLLLISSFSSGEVFRSGCLFERGNGKIFYFQPGHESFPTYYNESVQTIIKNAVRYLTPTYREAPSCPHVRRITEEGGYVIK